MSNFIILIGGPGEYDTCDKEHDASWANYVNPIQIAMLNGHIKAAPGETIHWLVYEPAYVQRWADDIGPNSNLAFIQKQAASVRSKGAANYMDRISAIANSLRVNLVKIQRKQDFWNYLGSLPDGSISRVWYSGHADHDGLILRVFHSNPSAASCPPDYYRSEQVLLVDIQPHISPKFSHTPKPSVFLGCNTFDFGVKWNSIYGVPVEGAKGKVNFGALHQGDDRISGIKRICNTATIKWESIN